MLLRRLEFILKKIRREINSRIKALGLNTNYMVFMFVCAFIAIFLIFNIYKTISKAELNYRVRQQEEQRRDELKKENEELDRKIAYLKSADYRKSYAADSLNLASPGESIYEIKDSNIEVISDTEENLDPVNLEDNEFWWKLLINLE